MGDWDESLADTDLTTPGLAWEPNAERADYHVDWCVRLRKEAGGTLRLQVGFLFGPLCPFAVTLLKNHRHGGHSGLVVLLGLALRLPVHYAGSGG